MMLIQTVFKKCASSREVDWHRVLSKALLLRSPEQTHPQQWGCGKLGFNMTQVIGEGSWLALS